MKKEIIKSYIFNEYYPNSWMMVTAMSLYSFAIWRTDLITAILMCLSLLFFGWSLAFSKKIKGDEK